MGTRTSNIWKLPTAEFSKLVLDSTSYTEVLAFFGLKNKGSNGRTLKLRLQSECISTSHFHRPAHSVKPRALTDVLCVNSTYSRVYLKKRLIDAGLLKELCAICSISTSWNNKPLVLIIDHINGIGDDNRLENLRLICPNCNSQCDTFAGKNKRCAAVVHHCVDCGKVLFQNSKCRACLAKYDTSDVSSLGLSNNELAELVWIKPVSVLAAEFNISDTAIRKLCMRRNIKVPPRGYWQKLRRSYSAPELTQ